MSDPRPRCRIRGCPARGPLDADSLCLMHREDRVQSGAHVRPRPPTLAESAGQADDPFAAIDPYTLLRSGALSGLQRRPRPRPDTRPQREEQR